MNQKLLAMITPADTIHGMLGLSAVLNGIWLDWLNPAVQAALTVGGAIYLYYMIRAKRMEWKLKQAEYAEKLKEQNDET